MGRFGTWLRVFGIVLCAVAATHASGGKVSGTVIDGQTGKPLPGANVQILGTTRGASADRNGAFLIANLPPGRYSVRASMIGYRAVTIDGVSIAEGQEVRLAFALQPAPIEFDPIVVVAGKAQQRLDQAPVSISVVSARDIQQRAATNLIDALETAPGVNFIGEQINIRGSTGYTFGAGNKVLLLLDGVPVYASDTGQFNWDMLPPLDIEQIEVLKGAGSTLWGASALGGVVNVITKTPSPEGQVLLSWTAGKYDRPYYDEWRWTDPDRLHYTREDLSYSRSFGPLGLRLSAGRFTSTGYTQLGDFQKYNLTGRADYRLPNSARLTLYAAYSYIKRGFFVQWKGQNDPYEVDEANLGNRAATNQLACYAKVVLPISARLALNVRGSLVRTLMGNQFGPEANFNPAWGQGFEVQTDWLPHSQHTITAGLQYQHDAGSTKYFGSHRGFFVGPYLQDEWRLRENLRLTAGVRYDRYQIIGGIKEDLFSPRLGVNWQPWATTSVRASVGSGFRAATIVERYLELTVMNFKIKANPGIRAEHSWAYDVGLRHYLTRDWNVDVSFFDNEYWDMIEAHLDLIRGQIQFRNVTRARVCGVEATSNMSIPLDVLGRRWTPGLHLSVTAMDPRDVKWNEPLTYRPKVIGTVKADIRVGRLQGEIDYRYASKIDKVKIYPINQRVPMKFVDLRCGLELGHLTVRAGINNLLQYNYAPMESNLMPMRTFFVGLQGGF
ncbi:MAG: TonB-dependent receptor [candidate division KSB1 bacterium]|nr:TonB-dependent receptor [candidate division KSB1 bacterium]